MVAFPLRQVSVSKQRHCKAGGDDQPHEEERVAVHTEQRRDLARMDEEDRAKGRCKTGKSDSQGKCVVATDRGCHHHYDRSRGDQHERQEGEHISGSHGSSPESRELVCGLREHMEHGLWVEAQPEQQSDHQRPA